MQIERIWTGNRLRNFNYVVACRDTGEALAIDPLDHQQVLQIASRHGWSITQVVNTHEHGDHIGGNRHVIAATGAKLLAHADAAIPEVDIALRGGDIIKVGTTVRLEVLDTPGHTMTHVCLLGDCDDKPVLFCGDTMFNAGVGNCHNGGHPDELYKTFAEQLSLLPDQTRIYPGHDYLANNLRFTLDREPGNKAAAALLRDSGTQADPAVVVTDVGIEKQINTFFRLQNPEIIDNLKQKFPDLPDCPDARTVFLCLRELRNSW